MLAEFVLLFALIVGLWWYLRTDSRETYWARRNVPFVDTEALGLSQFGQHSVFERYDIEIAKYKEMKRRGHAEFAGIFETGVPLLYVYGTDLLEQIFVKDFMSCVNRRVNSAELSDPIARRALFHAKNQEWKDIRSAINPMFTTGKIRAMCPMISDSARELTRLISEAAGNEPVDMRKLFHRFSTDIAVQIIYGTKSGAFDDPPGGFFSFAGRMHAAPSSAFQTWKWRMILKYPWVGNFLKVHALNPEAVNFFRDVLRQCRMNLEDGVMSNWNTFVGRMMTLVKKGNTEQEEVDDNRDVSTGTVNKALVYTNSKFVPTEEHMVGSAMSLFTAQSSNMLEGFTCVIFELVNNPEIQEKLFREIQTLENNEPTWSLDSILQLGFLEQVIQESTRKYGVLHLERRTNAAVHSPKYNITIPRNTQIIVPIHAIHHDPEIYPDPQKFDPDRFSPENIKKRNPFTFLPFGAGPRNCIAYRVAKAELKITVVQLLQKFKFSRCSQTPQAFALGSPLLVNVEYRK